MSDGQILLIPEVKFHILTNETQFLQSLFDGDLDFAGMQPNALKTAAASGRLALTTNLLRHATQSSTDQALIAAAENGKLEVAQTLLTQGARVDANKEGFSVDGRPLTALILAAKSGHYEIARLLIEHGANANASEGMALCYATFHRHTNIVELLHAHGATNFTSVFHPARPSRAR